LIIDSVIWITLKYERDKFHSKARELIPEIIKNNQIFVTDYIIIEVYSFLLRKAGIKVATATLDMFQHSEKIKILYNDDITFNETLPILSTHPFFSIVDANII